MKAFKFLVWLVVSLTYGSAVFWLLLSVLGLAGTFLFPMAIAASTLFNLRIGLGVIATLSLLFLTLQGSHGSDYTFDAPGPGNRPGK